jgi:hypothetical protein
MKPKPILLRSPPPDGEAEYVDANTAIDEYRRLVKLRDNATPILPGPTIKP